MTTRIITRGYGAGTAGSTVVSRGYGGDPDVNPGPSNLGLKSPFYDLTKPGIRWANAPRGRPEFVERNGTRVEHINTIMNVVMGPAVNLTNVSGVVRFRGRSLPSSVQVPEGRNLDTFGNVIYPGTHP